MTEVIKNKSSEDLLKSILAENAKALNEINCAKRDIEKANRRINFLIVLANELINRGKD